jgi:hypothetical protein
VTPTITFSLSLSLSLSIYVYISISLYLYLDLSLSISISPPLTLTLAHSVLCTLTRQPSPVSLLLLFCPLLPYSPPLPPPPPCTPTQWLSQVPGLSLYLLRSRFISTLRLREFSAIFFLDGECAECSGEWDVARALFRRFMKTGERHWMSTSILYRGETFGFVFSVIGLFICKGMEGCVHVCLHKKRWSVE